MLEILTIDPLVFVAIKWLSCSLTQWNTPLALTSMIRLQSLYPISDLDSPLRGLREVVTRPGNLP